MGEFSRKFGNAAPDCAALRRNEAAFRDADRSTHWCVGVGYAVNVERRVLVHRRRSGHPNGWTTEVERSAPTALSLPCHVGSSRVPVPSVQTVESSAGACPGVPSVEERLAHCRCSRPMLDDGSLAFTGNGQITLQKRAGLKIKTSARDAHRAHRPSIATCSRCGQLFPHAMGWSIPSTC